MSAERIAELVALGTQNPQQAPQALVAVGQLLRRGELACGPEYTPPTQVHPPLCDDKSFVLPMMSPSRWLSVPGLAAIAPQGTLDAQLQFNGGAGLLIGFRATVINLTLGLQNCTALELASMEVQVNFNDRDILTTNGEQASFVNLNELCGSLSGAEWAPFMRHVDERQRLRFTFRNRQPAGGFTLVPSMTFAFWPDKPRG